MPDLAKDVIRVGMKLSATIPGQEPVYGSIEEIGKLYLGVKLDGLTIEAYIDAPPVNTGVRLRFTTETGIYLADCGFRGSALLPKQMWYVDRPEVLERQQQREFVRVPVHLPLYVKQKNIYGTYNDAEETTTIDISGDGLCFAVVEPVPVASVVSFLIRDLPGMETFCTEGDVVRCTPIVNSLDRTVYHVGVTFRRFLSRGMRARLLRAVTQLQRSAIKRGMGVR